MGRTPSTSTHTSELATEQNETATGAPRRIDRLAEVVDLCTAARRIADDLDEKLLAYLLAMAIQETRAGMRQQVAATAGTVRLAPRRAKPRREPV